MQETMQLSDEASAIAIEDGLEDYFVYT